MRERPSVRAKAMDASGAEYVSADAQGVSLKGIVIGTRPWSWTAILIPILLAAQLEGHLLTLNCLKLVVMGCSTQAAANLLNSYFDFRKGVDTTEDAGDDSIIAGHVPAKLCLPIAVLMLLITAAVTWGFMSITAFRHCFYVGLLIAVFYTAPPFPLKYYALGDIAVFVAFGPVVMQAVAAALTGELDDSLYLFCVPTGLLTEAILWANNARDIEADGKAKIWTVCRLIGFGTSKLIFQAITYGAYVACAGLAWQRQGYGLLLPLLTLPIAVQTCGKFQPGKDEMKDAPERSAQLHLPFGLLMVIGLVVDCYTVQAGTCTFTG